MTGCGSGRRLTPEKGPFGDTRSRETAQPREFQDAEPRFQRPAVAKDLNCCRSANKCSAAACGDQRLRTADPDLLVEVLRNGRDERPLSVNQKRPDEDTAFAIVTKVLGVEVDPYNCDGRQNAVDALLRYPDGHEAALEVSSLGPEAEAAITSILRKLRHQRAVEGIRRTWAVTIPRDFPPADLGKLDGEREAASLDLLYAGNGAEAGVREARKWVDAGLRADVVTVSEDQPPRVWLTLDGIPGTVDGAEHLLAGLAVALSSGKMQSKIHKTGALGHEERRLFLRVRMSAFSPGVTDNIYFGGPLPSDAPQLPGGLSQVWLCGGSVGGTCARSPATAGSAKHLCCLQSEHRDPAGPPRSHPFAGTTPTGRTRRP